jgi:hypothetical protein
MANMELIGGPTGGQLSSAQSSITFSNIPQTYTDLVLKVSARTTFSSTSDFNIEPNGSAANLTGKRIYGTGTSVLSDSATWELTNGTDTTSNTFINTEVYFPNYASSNYKSFSSDGVMENNATFAYSYIMSHLWADNTPISSLTIRSGAGNFVAGSTFYLYGISNVTSGSKATGGIVSSDGTYWYHMFPYSSTFTPTQSLTADYLVVAGGGGGGTFTGGGGGAGGLVYQTAQSLTAQGYSIVVGGGGAGATGTSTQGGNNGANGVSSTFNSLTALGGGGGSIWHQTFRNGVAGGSGGGGGENAGAGTGGASTQTSYSGTGFGNAGGAGTGASPYAGGGGGGAGAVGAAAGAGVGGGSGGIGKQYLDFSTATQTGANDGYYAGGGGGVAAAAGYAVGIGGLGGGGSGVNTVIGTAGTANTGGGGGAGFGGNNAATQYGGAGGSGLVIIRYAI